VAWWLSGERWIRDRKVHGSIPGRCTTKQQLWASCLHIPACVDASVYSGWCRLVTFGLQFDSHCRSFASNLKQVANLLCAQANAASEKTGH